MKFVIEVVTLLSIASLVLGVPLHIPVFENDADCVDIRDVAECQQHKEMDKYCEYEEEFMLKNCPKTCNLCHKLKQPRPPTGIGCEDKRSECAEYAAIEGYCDYTNDFMSENCRKSCGFCQPSGVIPPESLYWKTEEWEPCKDGKQWRPVQCYNNHNGKEYQVDISYCEDRISEEKPEEERSC